MDSQHSTGLYSGFKTGNYPFTNGTIYTSPPGERNNFTSQTFNDSTNPSAKPNLHSNTNTSKLVDVTVFWDIENCAVPSDIRGFQVVTAMRKFVGKRQGILKNINAFGNLNQIRQELRAELQQSGVLLHDVPPGKPSAADMALMVEFLKLVADHRPPHHVVLVSGDRDFSNVLNVLVFRGYEVTLIHLSNASEILIRAATVAIEWRSFLSGEAQLTSPTTPHIQVEGTSTSSTPSQSKKSSADPIRKASSGSNLEISKLMQNSEEKNTRYFSILKEALDTLKKESFKPTEKALEKAVKRIFLNQGKTMNSYHWKEILNSVNDNSNFKIFGTEPKRVIYLANDVFGGVDPQKGPKKDFPDSMWNDFRQFLKEHHPVSKSGRFRFAEYVKALGPASLQGYPLAKIAQFVEVAITRKMLAFSNGVVSSIGPNGALGASAINSNSANDGENPLSPEIITMETVKNEIIRFVDSKKKVQIGTLSNHLINKQMLGVLKSYGGLKQFIEENKICLLRKDNHNGLYVCAKQNLDSDELNFLQPIIDFLRSKNGKVNIGALSTFTKNRGLAQRFDQYGGLKRYLESVDFFELETDGTSCFVTLKDATASPNKVPIIEEKEINEEILLSQPELGVEPFLLPGNWYTSPNGTKRSAWEHWEHQEETVVYRPENFTEEKNLPEYSLAQFAQDMQNEQAAKQFYSELLHVRNGAEKSSNTRPNFFQRSF